jgi:hypothetical protein
MAEEKLAKQFLDIVDGEAFTRATELAMLALMQEPGSTSLDMIRGAQRFLEILKALPEPAKLPTPRPSHNLDHNLR